jgi:hypothetical protein
MISSQELEGRGYSSDESIRSFPLKPSDKLSYSKFGDEFYASDILADLEKYNNTEIYYQGDSFLVQVKDSKNVLLLRRSDNKQYSSSVDYNYTLSSEFSPGNSIVTSFEDIEKSLQSKTIVADGLAVNGEYSLFVGFKQTGLTLCLLKAITNQIATGEVEAKNIVYMTGNASKQGFVDIAKALSKHGVETVYVDNLLIPGSKAKPFIMKRDLSKLMNHYIDLQEADKTVIAIDMLKNVCYMGTSDEIIKFNSSIRKFTMEGGTVLINASPNKNTNNSGNPVPPGFNDVIEGCNSLFLVTKEVDGDTTTVKYENESGALKDKEVYWQFKNNCNSYSEVFNSCVRVSAEDIKLAEKAKSEFITLDQRAEDLHNNIIVCEIINSGVVTKTKLKEELAKRCQLSIPKAKELLDKYTNTYWMCSTPKSGGGARMYSTRYTEKLLKQDAKSNFCLSPYVEMEEESLIEV